VRPVLREEILTVLDYFMEGFMSEVMITHNSAIEEGSIES
jgi:hypothetical protein